MSLNVKTLYLTVAPRRAGTIHQEMCLCFNHKEVHSHQQWWGHNGSKKEIAGCNDVYKKQGLSAMMSSGKAVAESFAAFSNQSSTYCLFYIYLAFIWSERFQALNNDSVFHPPTYSCMALCLITEPFCFLPTEYIWTVSTTKQCPLHPKSPHIIPESFCLSLQLCVILLRSQSLKWLAAVSFCVIASLFFQPCTFHRRAHNKYCRLVSQHICRWLACSFEAVFLFLN